MNTIIIDDEEGSRNNLRFLLENYCPDVQLVGMASNVEEGLDLIKTHQPQVVFLDIEMPKQDGFQLIKQLPKAQQPKIVFTSAYEQYALKAFQVAAVDYLLKPIDIELLNKTIERLKPLLDAPTLPQEPKSSKKLVIPHQTGLTFLEENEIICLEAERNYTKIHTTKNKILMVAKTLGDFEQLLQKTASFFRSHRSFIINLDHLEQFVNKDGGYLLLNNNLQIPLSRNRREHFFKRIQI